MIIDSLPRLVAQVRQALADRVLPELPVQTWTAANVRSSISILTYVEDALRLQRPFLLDANGRYRALLAQALDSRGDWLTPELRQRVRTVLERYRERPAWADAEALSAENLEYREVITGVIRASAAARRAGEETALHASLHAALAEINAREFAISERASKLPPF